MCEENLRIRRGLVRKKDNEPRAFFKENRTQSQVDLREAGQAVLFHEGVFQAHI